MRSKEQAEIFASDEYWKCGISNTTTGVDVHRLYSLCRYSIALEFVLLG